MRRIWADTKKICREAREKKPLPVLWVSIVAGVPAGVVAIAVLHLEGLGAYAGWSLAGIFTLGIVIALLAPEERGNRAKVWGEIGRSLLVAGLLAFAVWLIGYLQRPIEEREALQAEIGFQQSMPGVDLHEKDLNRFDLSGKNLEDADLENAELRKASLVGTKLRGADLSSADLTGADLEAADLSEADLSDATLVEAEASTANLRKAEMPGADLSGAQLSGADLRRACLAGGSLAGASLPDAHLEGAALTETNLAGARFWFDLRGANLRSVGLDGAKNAEEAFWPPHFEKTALALVNADSTQSPPPVVAPHATGAGIVLAVPDGDTVLLGTREGKKAVRLIGLDAPEIGNAGGGAARNLLRKLLPHGSRVSFTSDRRRTDAFDRKLFYLFDRQGRLVNQELLERGVAVAAIDPRRDRRRNARYARQLIQAEAWAREHALGLWRACPP